MAQLGGDAAGRVDNDGDGCTRRGGLAASGSGGGGTVGSGTVEGITAGPGRLGERVDWELGGRVGLI